MWTVGHAGEHDRFLRALGSSHGYEGKVEAWLEGEFLGEVEFEQGMVQVTARSRERRSINGLKVKESAWPVEASDALSPFGCWITCQVRVTAGAKAFPWIPVFAGKVTVADKQRWSGYVSISAADPMRQVNLEAFEDLTPAQEGTLIPSMIRHLLRDVFPEATLEDQTGSTATVPAGLAWNYGDGSRGRAIDELAASIGAEVYARPTTVWPGLDAVIRPVPSLSDSVAWTLPDGEESVTESDRLLLRGDSVKNRWVVRVERSSESPVRVVESDDDSASPTRYGGPMGRLPGFWSSPLITTEAQAQLAARAKLAQSIGMARPRTVTVVANPALEAGDVLLIGVDGEAATQHIADDFSVPLTHEPASMTINTRSTGGSE